jgi:hypothetical protein
MKKLSFFLMMLTAFIRASCGFKPETSALANELETFTEQSEDGNNILVGVRNIKTGDVLIPPNQYISITADEHLIICKDVDSLTFVYTIGGIELGRFDIVTHWNNHGEYYLCAGYNTTCYYFPKIKEVVYAKCVYNGLNYLFLETDEHWQIRDYDGKFFGYMPNICTLIKDESAKEETYYFLTISDDERSSLCRLYTIDGKKIKTFNANQWENAEKKLEFQQILHGMAIMKCKNVKNL